MANRSRSSASNGGARPRMSLAARIGNCCRTSRRGRSRYNSGKSQPAVRTAAATIGEPDPAAPNPARSNEASASGMPERTDPASARYPCRGRRQRKSRRAAQIHLQHPVRNLNLPKLTWPDRARTIKLALDVSPMRCFSSDQTLQSYPPFDWNCCATERSVALFYGSAGWVGGTGRDRWIEASPGPPDQIAHRPPSITSSAAVT